MEMTDIKTCVRSLTRGRARLRHERLSGLDAQTIATAESFLMGLEGVTSAAINPRVGSLLLTWDESVTNAETLLESAQFFMAFLGDDEDAPHDACGSEPCCGDCDSAESASQTASHADSCRCCESARGAIRAVEGAIHRAGGAALDLFAPVLAPDQHKGGRKRRVTQNRLMLLAYLASIGILGFGAKRLHWVIGTGFTALLGVHLYQHRRVL